MTVTGRRGKGPLLKTEETTIGGWSVIAVDMASHTLQNFEQKAESFRPKRPPNQ